MTAGQQLYHVCGQLRAAGQAFVCVDRRLVSSVITCNVGGMSLAARDDVLQMLADRLRDDPAAVLELLEQTTAALLDRQADPTERPASQPPHAHVTSTAKQLAAEDDTTLTSENANGRPSRRPATSGEDALPLHRAR